MRTPNPSAAVAGSQTPCDTVLTDSLSTTLGDLDGFYVPRNPVRVGYVEVTAFELGSAAHLMTRDSTGQEGVSPDCSEQVVTRDSLHLRCEVPSIGTVAIAGAFLVTRLKDAIVVKTVRGETREAVDVADAVVTVTRGAHVDHSPHERFVFRTGE